nr:hypothetical protein [Tanacetum cinerariifolium]
EDKEEEEIVAEDEAEIIYPYDEAYLNNRPPPTSDDKSEFASSVIPMFDDENRPVPPVIHFGSTYERGESSFSREILKDIDEVYPFGPVSLTIGTAIKRIRRLNEQICEQAEVDERIVKKIDRSDLRIRMVDRDAMSLDGAVRQCQADVSKVISMMESMSLEFEKARNAAMADDDVKADDVEDSDVEDDDMDDNAADPSDLQSFELLLLCPDVVPTTKKKIGQYIKGLPSYIKGETYASKPTPLNEAVRMAHGLMEHKTLGWNERNAEQNKRKWEGGNQGNNQGNRNNNWGSYRDKRRHNQNNNQINGGARAMTQA